MLIFFVKLQKLIRKQTLNTIIYSAQQQNVCQQFLEEQIRNFSKFIFGIIQTDFSDRIARNQQTILRKESYLDKVTDPTSGCLLCRISDFRTY